MNSTKSDGTPIQATQTELSISLLAFMMFVIVTSEFIVVGLLPAMSKDLNISLAEAGWFVTWFALAASLFGPPLTLWAGRYDTRHFLIVAVIFFAIGNLVIALAPSYHIVIGIRLLQGCILPAIASVVVTLAVRLAGAMREGWAISRVNIGVVVSTVLGVPAGAMITDKIGWPASFVCLVLLGLISVGLFALRFPRICMKTTKQPKILTEVSLLWEPNFLMHLLLSCTLFAGMFAGYTYIAALFGTLANFDGVMIGWVLMGFGLAGVCGNWIAGSLVDRDPLAATAWVTLVLAFSMAAVGSAREIPLSLLGLVVGLWGAAHMAAFVICQARVMRVGRESQAFALSLNISACNLGIGLGATLGGWVVEHSGVEVVSYAGATITVAALLFSIVMILARSRRWNTT